MSNRVISVSSLVRYLKQRLEGDPVIQHVLVEGEISNFSPYKSGHWYFVIKDAGAQIKCVMFSSYNQRVTFRPKEGDKVIVGGEINVYEQRGELQMMVNTMKPSGAGDLFLQFEALKKKLNEQGVFDERHKKPVPKYPFRIALVTGANTAARSDVLTTLARRWPVAEIIEYPVLVQGEQSAGQIVRALLKADLENYDVILLVRGGGSIEDLWSFNDETLAYTIYNLKTPIITGVGHETDFTIVDFVSDLRAPTPTGAAERCAPDIKDVRNQLDQYQIRINNAVSISIDSKRQHLKHLSENTCFRNPERMYRDKTMALDNLQIRMDTAVRTSITEDRRKLDWIKQYLMQSGNKKGMDAKVRLVEIQNLLQHSVDIHIKEKKSEFGKLIELLDAYSPLGILSRGYGIARSDGNVVRSVNDVKVNDKFELMLSDGKLLATVDKVFEEDHHG